MKQVFCDICGKKVDENWEGYAGVKVFFNDDLQRGVRERDLCAECREQLRRFLRPERTVEIPLNLDGTSSMEVAACCVGCKHMDEEREVCDKACDRLPMSGLECPWRINDD